MWGEATNETDAKQKATHHYLNCAPSCILTQREFSHGYLFCTHASQEVGSQTMQSSDQRSSNVQTLKSIPS